MLPDVVDADSVQMKTRREEMFYALFVLANKLGTGISITFSTGIYGYVLLEYSSFFPSKHLYSLIP